jgi:hypothetical protein
VKFRFQNGFDDEGEPKNGAEDALRVKNPEDITALTCLPVFAGPSFGAHNHVKN